MKRQWNYFSAPLLKLNFMFDFPTDYGVVPTRWDVEFVANSWVRSSDCKLTDFLATVRDLIAAGF